LLWSQLRRGSGLRLRRFGSGSQGEIHDRRGFQWLAVEQWRSRLGQESSWCRGLGVGDACGREDGFWSVRRLVGGGIFSLRREAQVIEEVNCIFWGGCLRSTREEGVSCRFEGHLRQRGVEIDFLYLGKQSCI
jgi:hypothetical protein